MQKHSAAKLDQLKKNLQNMNSVAIAYSGGVDSSFLLKIAHDVLGEKTISVIAISSTFPQWETEKAKDFTKKFGIKNIVIKTNELKDDNFVRNPENRCYYCKKNLFSKIKQVAIKEKTKYVLDGSNIDDVSDYRPGMKALEELGVVSPLKEVGLTKKEIRELSNEMNLDTWDKPSFACLASRFPYGEKITKLKLEQVEKAEDIIRALDIKQFRVRHHNKTARIEVSKNDFQKILKHSENIVKYFKKLGFKYITLDIEGYRTGSLNEVLDQ